MKYRVSYKNKNTVCNSLKSAFDLAKSYSNTLPNCDNSKEHTLSSFRKHIAEYTEINIWLGSMDNVISITVEEV